MTCREFADFMAEYFSGELAPEIVARFEYHLGECPNCVAYLSNYRDASGLGRAAFAADDADVPGEVPSGLIDAILASRRS